MSNLKNILFLLDLLLLNIIVCESGKDCKAYKEVPNGDLLKFRIGNGLGAYSGWDDAKVTKLAANVGYKGQRKKFQRVILPLGVMALKLMIQNTAIQSKFMI